MKKSRAVTVAPSRFHGSPRKAIAATSAAVLSLYALAFIVVSVAVMALFTLLALGIATAIVTRLIQSAPKATDSLQKAIDWWSLNWSPLHWAVCPVIVAFFVATWVYDLTSDPPPRVVVPRPQRPVPPPKHRRLVPASEARTTSEKLFGRPPQQPIGQSRGAYRPRDRRFTKIGGR